MLLNNSGWFLLVNQFEYGGLLLGLLLKKKQAVKGKLSTLPYATKITDK